MEHSCWDVKHCNQSKTTARTLASTKRIGDDRAIEEDIFMCHVQASASATVHSNVCEIISDPQKTIAVQRVKISTERDQKKTSLFSLIVRNSSKHVEKEMRKDPMRDEISCPSQAFHAFVWRLTSGTLKATRSGYILPTSRHRSCCTRSPSSVVQRPQE